MAGHVYHPQTNLCFGCGAARDGAPPDCPALYGPIGEKGAHFVLTPGEELLLFPERGFRSIGLKFEMVETFAIRDAIDEGVAELRRRRG